MKRIFAMLISLLLLCSCGSQTALPPVTEPTTTEAETTATEATTTAEVTTTEVTTTEVTTTEVTTAEVTTTEVTTAEVTTTEVTTTEVTTTEVTTTEVTTEMTTTVTTPAEEEKDKYDGILHAEGRLLISPEGEEILIKGISLGNEVWGNPKTHPTHHHTEDTYRELSEMGFNSVRFYLNYGLFEDDDNPYEYKESGFEWLDDNIAWAKENGIGIILNMHYPQGGYQSQGNGEALWNDVENQNRLRALWTEIAKRYANESTIWGYGLINEPVVVWQGSKEETIDYYKSVVQRIVDSMREYTNQAIFIEKICAAEMSDGTTEWGTFTPEEAMCILEGENLVYEFHNYSPHKFTHQDMEWAGTKGNVYSYPDDTEYGYMDITDYWIDCLHTSKVSSDNGWEYREASELYTGDEEYNIGVLAINAGRIGTGGTVYFDDLTITEISPEGEEKIIVSYSFDTDETGTLYPWSADGSGNTSHYKNIGHSKAGCVKLSGATDDYTVSCGDRFVLKEGYTYKVSGYFKTENCNGGSIRIDYGHASGYAYLNKDYLKSELLPFIQISEEHDVPIYLGEFGVCVNGFKEGRGGKIWVGDMLSLCREFSLNFNYHTYHEASFGLHTSHGNTYPSDEDLNKELYDCMVENLNNHNHQ